jgi:hypothetical protein
MTVFVWQDLLDLHAARDGHGHILSIVICMKGGSVR